MNISLSQRSGAKTIKKNTNSTQNKSETHCAKQYEVTSFLSTDCELSTETCSKNVYSLGPWLSSVPRVKRMLRVGISPNARTSDPMMHACGATCLPSFWTVAFGAMLRLVALLWRGTSTLHVRYKHIDLCILFLCLW